MKEMTPYLNFDGNTREVMNFYKTALGAELHMMTFGEAQVPCPDSEKNRIMHARLTKGTAVMMASDTMPGMPYQKGNNFSITVNCDNAEEVETLFKNLSDKATVTMQLQETFWAHRFGMLTDKFGINWILGFNKPNIM